MPAPTDAQAAPTRDDPDAGSLIGRVVGVTAERRREELGAALERRGASVIYGPAIRVVPLADDAALRAATDACWSNRPMSS